MSNNQFSRVNIDKNFDNLAYRYQGVNPSPYQQLVNETRFVVKRDPVSNNLRTSQYTNYRTSTTTGTRLRKSYYNNVYNRWSNFGVARPKNLIDSRNTVSVALLGSIA